MVKVRLEKVTKRFGDVFAADDVNLTISDGEFFTFLGPSGCGKTTTMRIVAGLEYPTEGRVYYDDVDVTKLPSFRRNTGMVFQNYALWPHMTVRENVAYGLKVRKLPREEVDSRVEDILELVHLGGMEERFPNQLSGGQQQRVALARVLVINPDILLLDEPLSNLDAKLRVEMREEIKDIQRRLGITTVYVTHDQEEAMAVSDRVAIQDHGKIMQVGNPHEIYDRPANLFVATFIGKGTLLEGTVDACGELTTISIGTMTFQGVTTCDEALAQGDKIACVLRPEYFTTREPEEPSNALEGTVEWSAFVGPITEVRINVGGVSLLINAPSDRGYETGSLLKVYIPKRKTIVLPWMKL